jgi:hypothetical protein
MTFVNIPVPTYGEMSEALYRHKIDAELAFWKQQAEVMQRNFENMWDHAKKSGRVELWRNGEKLELFTHVTPSAEAA